MTATSVDLNKYELKSPANITTHPIHMDGYPWMVHNHPSEILTRTFETGYTSAIKGKEVLQFAFRA